MRSMTAQASGSVRRFRFLLRRPIRPILPPRTSALSWENSRSPAFDLPPEDVMAELMVVAFPGTHSADEDDGYVCRIIGIADSVLGSDLRRALCHPVDVERSDVDSYRSRRHCHFISVDDGRPVRPPRQRRGHRTTGIGVRRGVRAGKVDHGGPFLCNRRISCYRRCSAVGVRQGR